VAASPSIDAQVGTGGPGWRVRPLRTFACLFAIRQGEGTVVALLGALFATAEMARGLGEVTADSLFVSRFGPEYLPAVYVVLGVASLIVGVGYLAAMGRLARRRLLVAVPVSFGVLLVVARGLLALTPSMVLPVLWLTVAVGNTVLLTSLWTVAGTTLDARQAKRLFPLCVGAAIGGAFVGSLAAGPLARLVGTENLLLVAALLLATAAGITAILTRVPERASLSVPGQSVRGALRGGYDEVARSPVMRLVAVAYVLFSILLLLASFIFLRTLEGTFQGRETDLTAFLGLVSAATTLVALVISVTLASRVMARFGVASAALLLPIVYVAGFGIWLTNFALSSVVAVRLAIQVTQRGFTNAAWSALFNVVPLERRAQVLAFADSVPSQVGATLAGLILIVLVATLPPKGLIAVGLIVAVASAIVVIQIRRRYGQAIVESLRTGVAEQVLDGGPGLASLRHDPQARARLRNALSDPDASVRRLAAEVLGALHDREAPAVLEVRLLDPDPEVRAAVLRALVRISPEQLPAERVRVAIDDEAGVVRVAAVQAAAALGRAMLDEASVLASDPDASVRAELAVAIRSTDAEAARRIVADLLMAGQVDDRVHGLVAVARLGDREAVPQVLAALGDTSAEVRVAAVRALAVFPDGARARGAVLRALDDDDASVREAASLALAGMADAAPELRRWASRHIDRADVLRHAGAALGQLPGPGPGSALPSEREFLQFLVELRRREAEDRVLLALSALGSAEASGLIRRSLRSDDHDLRGRAIEAVDQIGDRRLARSFVRFLDADVPVGPSNESAVLADLAGDTDPWIARLATRASAEAGGASMRETSQTLNVVDRMLFLRRVPLFARLEPEDLQRVAASCRERLYQPSEVLVREGEPGDELIVIVEGRVRGGNRSVHAWARDPGRSPPRDQP
jgi:HEAT repeat protein/ATP/ADP translocase